MFVCVEKMSARSRISGIALLAPADVSMMRIHSERFLANLHHALEAAVTFVRPRHRGPNVGNVDDEMGPRYVPAATGCTHRIARTHTIDGAATSRAR